MMGKQWLAEGLLIENPAAVGPSFKMIETIFFFRFYDNALAYFDSMVFGAEIFVIW